MFTEVVRGEGCKPAIISKQHGFWSQECCPLRLGTLDSPDSQTAILLGLLFHLLEIHISLPLQCLGLVNFHEKNTDANQGDQEIIHTHPFDRFKGSSIPIYLYLHAPMFIADQTLNIPRCYALKLLVYTSDFTISSMISSVFWTISNEFWRIPANFQLFWMITADFSWFLNDFIRFRCDLVWLQSDFRNEQLLWIFGLEFDFLEL